MSVQQDSKRPGDVVDDDPEKREVIAMHGGNEHDYRDMRRRKS
jgi:hypothetical protein